MKKWYLWFVLALIFAVSGAINYFDGRNITASIIQVGITVFFAFAQLICEKHGEKGKRVFRYISITVLTLLIVIVVILLIIALNRIPK